MFRQSQLLLICAVLLPWWNKNVVDAHRTIPTGVTCSSQFFSPETALTIPNPKVSWASYRIFTCDEPVFWLEAEAEDANQTFAFTVTVPVLDRFEDVRISVAIIGQSLPPLQDSIVVPDEVEGFIEETGYGVVVFDSPQNQSTCSHLEEVMNEASSIVDDRCNFYEPFGGSNSWVVLDREYIMPEPGMYKFAVFVEGGTTAKAAFACCDWPEDFVTPYEIPETDCPFCGTNPEENPAYLSHFYEQEDMAQYGGFPPAGSCDELNNSTELEPAADQCPPIIEDDDDSNNNNTQPASCALGCSKDGECHSHNIFGQCTHELNWSLQPTFGNANVSKVTIFVGDKINFLADSTHNLFEMPSQESFDQCAFDNATALASVEEVQVGHTISFDEAGMYYFSCGISCTGWPEEEESGNGTQPQQENTTRVYDPLACHCSIGQKIAVEVKDSSDAIQCHDHAQDSQGTTIAEPLICDAGSVAVSAVNNSDYGATDETKCADLCIPSAFVESLTGVEMGSCPEKGYVNDPVTVTIKPPGSPMAVDVRVTTLEQASTCHCHSYEEIACPEDEAPGDTLYAEHIEEIQQYCSGVLDGSEESCPYKCFQPMEVLHLHYLECASRDIDQTYSDVNATQKCHNFAPTAPSGIDCPVVTLPTEENGGSPSSSPMENGSPTENGSPSSSAFSVQAWQALMVAVAGLAVLVW